MRYTFDYKPHGNNGTVTLIARAGDKTLTTDKLDIVQEKKRSAWTDRFIERHPEADRADVEDALLQIATDLTAPPVVDDADDTCPFRAADRALEKMPEPVRLEAFDILESPDLFDRVVDDIESMGVAGEKDLASTVYLIGTSRLLLNPLAAAVQGQSSSGKSYTLETVARLMPPESVLHATQMTPQALFHMKPGSLRHKFIVAGERSRREDDSTADNTRALREMISSGRLVKQMPMRVGDEIQTVEISQDGPIAYIESTTLTKIFDEDATRMLMLQTDETAQQTELIMETLAARYATGSRGDTDHIIERHHAIQRSLDAFDVVIPFAPRVASLMPSKRVEARRALPRLMSMVEASALLHQRQRKFDSDRNLIASPDDYLLAAMLCDKPMARQLGGRVSDSAYRLFARMSDYINGDFTKPDVVKEERHHAGQAAIYGWLTELAGASMIDKIQGQQGKTAAVWRMVDAEHITTAAIPTFDQVFSDSAWNDGNNS